MIDETIEEIREMQTHSSSVVAVKATRSLAELTERNYATVEEFERDLERNVGALKRANQSHASLYNALMEVLRGVQGKADTFEEARELTLDTIDRVVESVEMGKSRAAENAASLFEDGDTFLTHDYSSTVMEAVELAVADGADLTAYVTEARPRFLGRKFARELAAIDGVEPHLMVDGASGIFLSECDRVVIGMDCIVDETLYNRVGTFPLVATATRMGVPVTVVGSSAKVVDDGFRFENEIRSPSEVMLEPVEGIQLENPAYDATPVELIDQVITDEGVIEF
ncbi:MULTISPECIES: translation initiation factor eIF-2B [Haloferax]|uniref:Translation initiation factor eIF-2B n=2 Tax=Haloferax TaxID=2251 RepID=A0A6G1Z2T2_9EURY|nr:MULTISPECIES: translation initiation factor eIF-2B [Haloferax]KAB1188049.1 translation initiation factor eIF-2B [Haloferax sp. CBA1149]MRW80721.1 translation initiation factor eIF-2B [Haloferax marinisediminis]